MPVSAHRISPLGTSCHFISVSPRKPSPSSFCILPITKPQSTTIQLSRVSPKYLLLFIKVILTILLSKFSQHLTLYEQINHSSVFVKRATLALRLFCFLLLLPPETTAITPTTNHCSCKISHSAFYPFLFS